jgi:hypothetical protein
MREWPRTLMLVCLEPMRWLGATHGIGLLSAAPAHAHIIVGPYEFTDETWFADTASMVATPEFLPISVTTIEEAVVGYSPMSGVMNVGFPCGSEETVTVGFTDILPFEGAGPDVLLFDARFSVDDYAVQVRPAGSGAFGIVHVYPSSTQTPTNVEGPSGSEVWGVEVDFADFGLALGTEVDAVRIVGNCDITPDAEFDLLMAAAVDRSCGGDDDCDDDDPCTVDSCLLGTCSYEAAPADTSCENGVCLGQWPPRCVECISDANCDGASPYCDSVSNDCVECVAASDCADDGEPCTVETCLGGSCTSADAPSGTPCDDGVCLGDGTACVACLSDEQCEPPTPKCDEAAFACVACLVHADCDDGDACTVDSCVEQACEHTGGCATTATTASAGGAPPLGEGGSGAGASEPEDGCSCRTLGDGRHTAGAWALLALLVAKRCRRRKARSWSARAS